MVSVGREGNNAAKVSGHGDTDRVNRAAIRMDGYWQEGEGLCLSARMTAAYPAVRSAVKTSYLVAKKSPTGACVFLNAFSLPCRRFGSGKEQGRDKRYFGSWADPQPLVLTRRFT